MRAARSPAISSRRLDPADPALSADRARLELAREARRRQAAAYFAEQAADWDRIRALHALRGAGRGGAHRHDRRKAVPQPARSRHRHRRGCWSFSRRAPCARSASTRAPRCWRSPAPASNRRALSHVQLRQGDIYAPPVERDGYDLIVIHQVLHFLDDPARALKEAARALAPGGRLVVVDFDAHEAGVPARPTSPIAGSASRSPRSRAFSSEAGLADIALAARRARAAANRASSPSRCGSPRTRESSRTPSRSPIWSSPDDRKACPLEPVRGACPRLVRVLPAEDPGNGGQPMGGGAAARTARPGFRFGHLRGRRLDARAHPRDGGAPRPRDDDEARRASDLRRRLSG